MNIRYSVIKHDGGKYISKTCKVLTVIHATELLVILTDEVGHIFHCTQVKFNELIDKGFIKKA